MKRLLRSIFSIIIFYFPLLALGVEKPSLNVKFQIKEVIYKQRYNTQEILWMEEEARKEIIDTLSNYFTFIEFTEAEKPDKFIISLEPKERLTTTTPLVEVVFRLTVNGPIIYRDARPVDLTFRQKEEYHSPIEKTKEEFLAEITLEFEKRLDQNRDHLVENLFSNVLIAENAHQLPKTLFLDLPFNFEIGTQSEFRLHTNIISYVNRSLVFVAEHQGSQDERIRAKIKEPKDEVEDISREMESFNVEIIVNKVYIILYKQAEGRKISLIRPSESYRD